jgi:hypothetical protein
MKSSFFWDIMHTSAFFLLRAGFLLGLYSDPEDGGNTFNGLYSIISQKIALSLG